MYRKLGLLLAITFTKSKRKESLQLRVFGQDLLKPHPIRPLITDFKQNPRYLKYGRWLSFNYLSSTKDPFVVEHANM